jgi:hypothetical protein
MCYSKYQPPLSDQSHQISPFDNPQSQAHRRRVMFIIMHGLGLLLLAGGINMLRLHDSWWRTSLGGVFVVIGSLTAARIAWRGYRIVRSMYRLRRDLCVHCGYATTGRRNMRCPECGKDPFE